MPELNILSYNVNGIRAAIKNGFIDWLACNPFDIVCLQEIKADAEVYDPTWFQALGYESYIFPAQKKGYSGVAMLTKIKPDHVEYGCGIKCYDDEGRNIRIDLGELSVMSAYFPSGTSGDERQDVKMKYLEAMLPYLGKLLQQRPKLLVCGDYNICHRAIDIHDPVRCNGMSGFKPEERAWMDRFFEAGFIDTFRHFHPDKKAEYSWWSYRANARANNKGWRIDYIAASEKMKSQLIAAEIFQDVKHSDHCPVFLKCNV